MCEIISQSPETYTGVVKVFTLKTFNRGQRVGYHYYKHTDVFQAIGHLTDPEPGDTKN